MSLIRFVTFKTEHQLFEKLLGVKNKKYWMNVRSEKILLLLYFFLLEIKPCSQRYRINNFARNTSGDKKPTGSYIFFCNISTIIQCFAQKYIFKEIHLDLYTTQVLIPLKNYFVLHLI